MWQKIKELAYQNRGKLFVLTASYFIMDLLSTLPYLNVAFTTRNKIFITMILAAFIFKFRTKAFLVIAYLSIFFSIFALFISRDDVAENLGNLLYLLLWAIFIINFPAFLMGLKKKE